MKHVLMIVAAALTVAVSSCSEQAGRSPETRKGPIKVVVVTGGHEFEHDPFFTLFQGYDDIEYVEKELEDDSEIFEDVSGWDYDVIVLYSMTQRISEKRQRNFLKLLDDGVGLVSMHHAADSFPHWPGYKKIIGCRYYLNKTVEDGQVREKSGYKHDVDVPITIVNDKHPVTRGLSNFTINDETYIRLSFEPDNVVLMTTEEPTSDPSLCWVRKYSKSNICAIQPGHGPAAYNDANYRRLVVQAIRWCAGRAE